LRVIARDQGAHAARAMSPTSKGIGIGATVIGLGGLAGTLAYVGAKKAADESAQKEREAEAQRREAEAQRREAERIEVERQRLAAEQIEAERKAEQKRLEEEAEQRRLEAERIERARIEAQKEEESEEGIIARHQKAHEEYFDSGGRGPIDLNPFLVAEGVRAYYAERTGLTPVSTSDGSTSGAFFVFERLCKATVSFWTRFVNNQLAATQRLGHELRNGATAFKKTVDLYASGCVGKYDMWVAYVSDSSPSLAATRKDGAKDTNIEMVVTVLVHRDTPVTSHIGIFRTLPYWRCDKKAHKNAGRKGLSPLIHAFAAAAALCLYKHLREKRSVMLTRPVAAMGEILRRTMQGEIRVGSPIERKPRTVKMRAEIDEQLPNEGYSNDIYTPPLGSEADPFFAEDARNTTWTFDGATYPQPEWMGADECQHTDVSPSTNDTSALEHTVRLSALARKWSAAAAPSDARRCSIVVGGARIPVQCEAGQVTLAEHRCLDTWASTWNELPRIAPFDFASGKLASGKECPVVEIHNKADGNCLLYALAFYLCVKQEWNDGVNKLRDDIMNEVERMLKDPSGTFDVHRLSVEGAYYTESQSERWAKHADAKKIDASNYVSKYVFVNKMDGVDLGDLEILAFSRLYDLTVCVWQEQEDRGQTVLQRILMVPEDDSSNIAVKTGGVIPNYGTCVHLRYYKKATAKGEEREDGPTGDGGHYTLLALLDSEAPGFGRIRRRYV
jgi:hypothetical protein